MHLCMLTFWLVNQHLFTNQNVMNLTYHKVVIINTLQLKARSRFYKMLMKEELDVYLLWPFKEKMISLLVTRVNAYDLTINTFFSPCLYFFYMFHAVNYLH